MPSTEEPAQRESMDPTTRIAPEELQ
jgi:hypothetical protein